jgi:diguanylate cyclase (GGDEF)-like protein
VPIVVDGVVTGAYLIGTEVTEQRRLEAAVREQTERVRALYMLAASTTQSAEDQIVSALELGCKLLRCDAGYVTRVEDGTVRYLYAAGQARHGAGSMEAAEESLHRFIFEAREPVSFEELRLGEVRAMIGTRIPISGIDFGTLSLVSTRVREEPFSDADRDFVSLMGALVASAIERSEQRQRADLLAFYDPLTELPNRTLLSDRLMQAISSADRHPTEFAVHFYDLDGFKAINDAHGHMRGDDVLRIVARRLERAARQEDTVARIGGDEFVVLQPAVHSRADVEALSRRLTAALAEPLTVSGIEYRLTASGGISMFPADGNDARTLLALADAALYRVKQSGRNGIAFVSPQS